MGFLQYYQLSKGKREPQGDRGLTVREWGREVGSQTEIKKQLEIKHLSVHT